MLGGLAVSYYALGGVVGTLSYNIRFHFTCNNYNLFDLKIEKFAISYHNGAWELSAMLRARYSHMRFSTAPSST